MLKGPGKTGSIKVLNKGADVAIVAAPGEAGEAMKASRILAVRGISTAVLEESCFHPMDEETLKFYEKQVRFFAAVGADAAKALPEYLGPAMKLTVLDTNDAASITETITKLVRNPELFRQMNCGRRS